METYKCQPGVMRRCEIHTADGCDGTYKGDDCQCAADNQAYMPPTEREELQAYRALGPVEELSALVKAQDEGRLHIDPPPAKEGDPKPGCFYEDGGTIWCLGLAPDGDDEPCDRCKACWYCESGDYADDRAEAEAAISAQRGDPHETDLV